MAEEVGANTGDRRYHDGERYTAKSHGNHAVNLAWKLSRERMRDVTQQDRICREPEFVEIFVECAAATQGELALLDSS
ncbi:hypothetical protein BOX37_26260 [Nocardia mangyaensis]|uniref:Uncharacterized protein n=1 Tax=Nocardia mangyaensis TaxID=2213200 RepID=A0A1J0VXR8_9NOCA|nr:hypothetical protein BOX37_26260 [Nocardia mangyaensis]